MNDRIIIGAIALVLVALRSPAYLGASDPYYAAGLLGGTAFGGVLIGLIVVRTYRAFTEGASNE